jgi:hypothetical protein
MTDNDRQRHTTTRNDAQRRVTDAIDFYHEHDCLEMQKSEHHPRPCFSLRHITAATTTISHGPQIASRSNVSDPKYTAEASSPAFLE